MQKTRLQKLSSFIVCIVLIAAMALVTTGCKDKKETSLGDNTEGKVTVLGEGQTKFDFTVTDADGKETKFEIHTDKKTVGEALQELDLIEGEEGTYGLFVKTVNGQTYDFDQDGKYWAFYVDDAYAMSGIDVTEIEAGVKYSLKVEE